MWEKWRDSYLEEEEEDKIINEALQSRLAQALKPDLSNGLYKMVLFALFCGQIIYVTNKKE